MEEEAPAEQQVEQCCFAGAFHTNYRKNSSVQRKLFQMLTQLHIFTVIYFDDNDGRDVLSECGFQRRER